MRGLINSLVRRMGRKRRTDPATAVDVRANLEAAVAREAERDRERWIAEAARQSRVILELRAAVAAAESGRERLLDSCAARELTIEGLRAEIESLRESGGYYAMSCVQQADAEIGSWSGLREGD